MSNEVNNLASSFVAMAQAFEKLPIVQAELDTAHTQIEEYAKHVQRLEMRLMDAKEELDNAHAATRKMEVERDHAETMFLETDDKLAKAKDVLKVLIGDAGDFLRVVEPPKPEPVIEQPPVNEIYAPEPTPVQGQSEQGEQTAPLSNSMNSPEQVSSIGSNQPETVEAVSPADPIASSTAGAGLLQGSAIPMTDAIASAGVNTLEPMQTQPYTPTNDKVVSVQQDPTPATGSSLGSDLSGLTESAVQPDKPTAKPYEGKRYTDVPFYVSLVEWLNGGGTEEAYYAR